MKKKFLVLFLGLVVLVCACEQKENKEETYETAAVATGVSKQLFSASASYIGMETLEPYQNESAVKEKTGTFLDASNELVYSSTESEPFTCYDVDIYTGKTNSEIRYQYMAGTNTLVMYRNDAGLDIGIAENASTEDIFTTLENLLSEELLPQGVDVKRLRRSVITRMHTYTEEEGIPTMYSQPLEGYVLPGENQEARYTIYYTYPMGDIESYEVYEFILSEEHALYQYHAAEPGTFSFMDVAINQEKLEESVDDFMEEYLKEKDAAKSYRIKGQYLFKQKDGKLAVVSYMEICDGQNIEAVEELFHLITPLE